MPEKAWSNKRERQYEHIKDSAKKQGKSTKRAKEIAARTVNKQRAQSGETKSKSSRGGGSSSRSGGSSTRGRASTPKTREQLYKEAQRLGIEGRSRMNKAQLQRAVSRKK
jgi:hypothetical protein